MSAPLGEFGRIRRFFAPLAGPGGLGLSDDAALIGVSAGRQLVATLDTMVAGVHYLPEDPPALVARKLLRVNLSDLAAMGARPRAYLLSTALPAGLDDRWVEQFAAGLGEDQRRFGVELLGGDSVATPGPAVLSLTALGEIATGTAIRRAGAQPGDAIWVSGTIGDAFLGLAVLRGGHPELPPEHRAAMTARFQLPEPRVDLGPRLVGLVHAMADISDGLVADLEHICEASGVGARVRLGSLPLSQPASVLAGRDRSLPARLATAGDDYELLFTAPALAGERIEALSTILGLPLTTIGEIEAARGVRVVDAAGQQIPIEATGYRHF